MRKDSAIVPLAVWDKAQYDKTYSSVHPTTGATGKLILHYVRAAQMPRMRSVIGRVTEELGITPADRVLMVGTGYGWEVELALEQGFDAVGTELSSYIETTAATTETQELRDAITAAGLDPDSGEGAAILAELDDGGPRTRVPLLFETLTTEPSRQAVRDAFANNDPTLVLTASAMECLTDASGPALAAELRKFNAPVAHMIVPLDPTVKQLDDGSLNWQTMAEWHSRLGDDTILDAHDGYKPFQP